MNDMTRRIRLVRDMDNERPDYDAQPPVIWYNVGLEIVAGKEHLPDAHRILEARHVLGRDLFERWVTIFVGPHRTLTSPNNDGSTYLEVFTQSWVDAVWGTVPGAPSPAEALGAHGTSDYQHWLNDDVYGLIPEVSVLWAPLDDDGDPILDRSEWRWERLPDDESVWGVFGRDWAETEAFEHGRGLWAEDEPFIVVDPEGDEITGKETK